MKGPGDKQKSTFFNMAGSSVTFVFTGTGVRWIGDKARTGALWKFTWMESEELIRTA